MDREPSPAFWKSLFEHSVDAVLLTRGHELIIEAANREACRLTGYTVAELVGQRGSLLFSRRVLEAVPFVPELVDQGHRVNRSRILLRKDGREVPVEMHSKLVADGLYQTSFRDVSEAQDTLERLKRSEEKFAKAFKTSPDAVNITRTRDGVYLEINEGFTAMSGYTAEDVVGRSSLPGDLGIWVYREDREKVVAELKATGMVRGYEATFRRKDGTQFVGSFSARKMDVGGEDCLLSITRDITQKRQTEEALRSAQKLEALGVLAGGIAHDFNNLLTGIFGFVAAARLELDPDCAATRDLDKALAVFDRAKALSYQLLTFAKGGAPVKQPVVLTRLLQEGVRFALSGSNVQAEVKVDDLWPCEADVHQIGQVLDNLLINARHAMAGGGRVLVEAVNVAEGYPLPSLLVPGRWIRVSVTDEGTGMAPEVLRRIFEPFFTTKPTGNGLGLATAFSILKRHGGHLEATSTLGKGSTFTFWLPATTARPAPTATVPLSPRRGPLHVLLLDDEAFIRSLAAQQMPAWGHRVHTVSTAQEAVEAYERLLRSDPFDLVVLDLTIRGGEGGREALTRLKALDPEVRAVASSGYSDDPVMADPLSYGFVGRLPKPYRETDFQSLVASLSGQLPEPRPQ